MLESNGLADQQVKQHADTRNIRQMQYKKIYINHITTALHVQP